jgi:hypothetical protein
MNSQLILGPASFILAPWPAAVSTAVSTILSVEAQSQAKSWEKMGKPWEKMGKPWEKMGKLWENYGKTMGKDGKTIIFQWKISGKSIGNCQSCDFF